MITQTGIVNDDVDSAVSWGAILAGATASAAITLVLVAFGVGVGFSVVSPWSGEGVSASTFTLSAGIYLIVIAMLSSTIGGYLAGRLRTRWQTVHEHERYFRDSAHGVVTWALATVVTAAVLGSATTAIIGATGAGLAAGAPAAARSTVTDGYIDGLMRPAPGRANAASTAPAAQSPAQANQQATDQATSPVATGQTAPNLQGGQIAAQWFGVRYRPHLSGEHRRQPHRPVAGRGRAARQPDHYADESHGRCRAQIGPQLRVLARLRDAGRRPVGGARGHRRRQSA
jgi:hypothetical protein